MRLPFNGAFPVSQTFGNKFFRLIGDKQVDVYAEYGYKGHNGIDYALPTGTPVLAPHSGIIKEATFDASGYGYYVKIENDDEGSVLAHLETIKVSIGFQLIEGDLIGTSDNSGNSTAPHLHWGYYKKPRNRDNGYGGFIDQTPYMPNDKKAFTFIYSVGDTIEPSVVIPTSKSPDTFNLNDLSYGHIGPGFPAKIISTFIGVNNAYYNVDQRSIGGGTGWVDAKIVDNAPKYIKPPEVTAKKEPIFIDDPVPVPSTAPVNSEKVYTQAEYDALKKERDDALKSFTELNSKFIALDRVYSGFVALGFNSVDDVTKTLKQKDDTNIGLQKQITTVLDRNTTLARLVSDKEAEDFTAIEEGIAAVQELKRIKDEITMISTTVGTKPKIFDIITHIENFKTLAAKALKQGQKEIDQSLDRTPPEVKAQSTTKSYGLDWLLNLLGFDKGVK